MALRNTGDTKLGRAVAKLTKTHPRESGIYSLRDSRDAFAARALLADAAERSIDVQYYIWHNDISGKLLFQALRRAADRGVRVRLLLDDNNTADLDATLAALHAHPNVEVRLFNPFMLRHARVFNYLSDFWRLNRRMHNKSFTVDNQVTIVGGRNIGDEYFGVLNSTMFIDLDVVAIGPIVEHVSASFDSYWASDSAYPANRVLPPVSNETMLQLEDSEAEVMHSPAANNYVQVLQNLPLVKNFYRGEVEFSWAMTWLVSDNPAKGLGMANHDELVAQRLKETLGIPSRSLDIISPYFVPSPEFVELLIDVARHGVRIRILTNSLEATDVAAVHAGYAKWRVPLLHSGVKIYETKRQAAGPPEIKSSSSTGSVMNSSGRSLHVKTISVDESRVFVGSFNVDRRSRDLNTEIGIVTESAALAQEVDTAFKTVILRNSYEVHLLDSGKLQWTEQDESGILATHDMEPGVTSWKLLGVDLLSILPLDWLY